MFEFGERGRAFYDDVMTHYALSVDEHEILVEAARCLDDLESIRTDPDAMSLKIRLRGEMRHLLAALGLPDSDVESGHVKRARRAAERRWGNAQSSE